MTAAVNTVAVFLLFLPLVSSFASYPLHEHAYSVRSLEEYSQSECAKIAKDIRQPGTLFDYLEREFKRVNMDFWVTFHQVMPYTNQIQDSATTMLACLSPLCQAIKNNMELTCPFDSHVARLPAP